MRVNQSICLTTTILLNQLLFMLSATISVNLCNYFSQLSQPIQPFLFIQLPIVFNQPSFNPLLPTLFVLFFPQPFSLLQPIFSPYSFTSQPNLSLNNQPVPNPCLNNLQPFFSFLQQLQPTISFPLI